MGYQARVPLLAIGPYAIKGVFPSQLEPASITRFIKDCIAGPTCSGMGTSTLPYAGKEGSVAHSVGEMFNTSQVPIPPMHMAPSATAPVLFARLSDPDIVTLAGRAWNRLHHNEKERGREELARIPQLNVDHCWNGTQKKLGHYVTAAGRFPMEACYSTDGKLIFRVGENPMDADERDERKTK